MNVGTVSQADPATSASSVTGRAKLTQKDFMKMLIAEMTHQDPTQPLDNQQMVQQMASMQTLESTAALTDGINSLVRVSQLSSASSLIGKVVHGADANGGEIFGLVQGVTVNDNKVTVVVKGQDVPLDSITDVVPASK